MRILSSLTNRIFLGSAAAGGSDDRRRGLPLQRRGHRPGRERAEARPRRGRHAARREPRDALRPLLARGAASSRTCRISRQPWTRGIRGRLNRSPPNTSGRSAPTCSSSPTRRDGCSPRQAACACRTCRRRTTQWCVRPKGTEVVSLWPHPAGDHPGGVRAQPDRQQGEQRDRGGGHAQRRLQPRRAIGAAVSKR